MIRRVMTQRIVSLFGACLAVTLVACGGADTTDTGSTSARTAAPAGAAAVTATDRCPLTAAQVSTAIGSPMTGPDSACGFDNENGKLVPHVLFVLQSDMACRENLLAELGYKEKVDGLGVAAYVHDDAEGAHVIACRTDRRPFEVVVDMPAGANSRAVATALAKQVLDAR